jgi:tetratricopeptide (TPR) repeat protein
MSLYLNELAPWERKNEYYHQIQLGKDVEKQSSLINQQTKAMVASQIASTNAIIASQDRIVDGLDNISVGIERVEQGVYELKAAFEWGISEVVWQIEQNREVLRNILEVLMAPLDTQAKERRKRAEEAYANGWIDDAEEEFLESERLNKFDFSIHISLGMIYLFAKIDKNKALSYFEKAIKYAGPKSAYHTSYALLHKALIKFDLGEIEHAEILTDEAISLTPEFTETLYQNAQYNAQLKNARKSIINLEKAIRLDKNYCLKANSDPLFDPIREHVNSLFEKIREEQKSKALKQLDQISNKHNKATPIIARLSNEGFPDASLFVIEKKQIDSEIINLKKSIQRNSYFDFLDANNTIAPQAQKKQDMMIEKLKKKVKAIIEDSKTKISSVQSEHKNKVQEYLGKTGSMILYGSFLVPAVVSLFALDGLSKLGFFIVFCIPFLSQIVSLCVLYFLIFNYSKMDGGDLVLAWSIVAYLIISVVYFLVSKATSEGEMEQEIEKQNKVLKQASPYIEMIKDL